MHKGNRLTRDTGELIFIQLETLKFNELVEYNLLKTMYKAHQKVLPDNLLNRFKKRESRYKLKGTEVFSTPEFRTKLPSATLSFKYFSFHGLTAGYVQQ